MKLNSISPYQIKNTPIVQKSNTRNVSFCSIIRADRVELFIPKALDKIKNYTIEEYKNLSKEEIKTLRNACKEMLPPPDNSEKYGSDESIHEMASECIKKYLDKNYGEDGYVVMIIGRSLSSIGKVLGYKIGEDRVKNIPLTRASRYIDSDRTEEEMKNGGLEALKSFLSSNGLSKEEIEKSDKKYIIMDYCYTGGSLKGAETLLTRDDVLGKKNIRALDVLKCVQDLSGAASLPEEYSHIAYSSEEEESLHVYMFYSKAKKFSFVSRVSCLKDIPKAVVDTTKTTVESRLMRFKLLDNFMRSKPKKQKIMPPKQKNVPVKQEDISVIHSQNQNNSNSEKTTEKGLFSSIFSYIRTNLFKKKLS